MLLSNLTPIERHAHARAKKLQQNLCQNNDTRTMMRKTWLDGYEAGRRHERRTAGGKAAPPSAAIAGRHTQSKRSPARRTRK